MTAPGALRLDDYLARVRYSGALSPSIPALRELHEAHLAAIPFENLDILLGRPIRIDLDSLQTKLIDERRGGYCFEQNTLFRAVLEAVGFRVDSLAARVRVGSDQLRARTHMLLRVWPTDEDRSYLADVGFGGDGFLHPVPLEPSPQTSEDRQSHRLRRERSQWVLETHRAGAWTDLYAFTEEPNFPVDFEVANHYTSTHPSSPFVRSLTAQRTRADARVVLRDRELVQQTGAAATRTAIRDDEHLLEVLATCFGLHFPAATRFPRRGHDEG